MQIRDGNSRYPENLAERFTLQEDAARKYEPTEERTLVLNFAEHWNRPAESKTFKRFSPFKNSLTEQFGHISFEITKTRELVTFIWSSLYRLRKKTERTVYMSHPSFYKTHAAFDEMHEVNMDNVAIRIPLAKNDLILMGDLRTYEDRKLRRKEYIVKGISILANAPHIGEKRVDTALISRVINTSIPGFYTARSDLAEGVPVEVYKGSVITGTLESDLNCLYTVSDPESVVTYLNEWKDFQAVQIQSVKENEKIGFTVECPEFITAYPLPKHVKAEKGDLILSTPDANWSRRTYRNIQPRLLAKITHRVDRRTFLGDRTYLSKFNSLAETGVKIVDPFEVLSKKKGSADAQNVRMSRMGDERLAPASVTGMPDQELIAPLRQKRDNAISEIKADIRTRSAELAERMTAEYMASEEVKAFLDSYTEGLADSIAAESEAEFGDASEGHIAEIASRHRKEKEQEVLTLKKAENSKSARSGFSKEKADRIRAVNEEYDRALMELPADSDECELTVYFEIPVRSGDSVTDEAARRTEFFRTDKHYKMVCDQTGTQTNLVRLTDALESLMRGEVANPYLASYLFPAKDRPHGTPIPIGHFFGNRFNETQKKAVEDAVNSDGLYLIQGPPGTGKTQVIAEITVQEVLRGRKVLITSQNNKAINNAFERLYRNAMVRPIRLMSEGNDSEYDIDRIVPTFYRNLSGSLRNQLDNYGRPDFQKTVGERFAEVKEIFSQYTEYREAAEESIEEIEYDEDDLRAIKQKLEDIIHDREENESRRELLRKQISTLDSFEMTAYAGDAEEIKNLFRPFVFLPSRDGSNAELERRLFGRYGYCARLMNFDEEQLADQMDLMENNRDYVSTYRRLQRAKDDKSRNELSQKLEEMIRKTGVRPDEFVLMNLFGADMPDSIPDIWDRLGRIRAATEHALNEELSAIPDSQTDEAKADKLRRELEDIEEELEDYRSDENYRKYSETQTLLSEKLQNMYYLLGLDERFSDFDTAYRILEHRVELICAVDEKGRDATRGIFEGVIAYLNKDKVEDIDRDRIARELGRYINVVGITCTADGQTSMTLDGDSFDIDVTTMGIDVVIIDEISKVPFPELLRPILSGKSIIMVGDHKQLPPIYNIQYDRFSDSVSEDLMERERRFRELYTTPVFKSLFEKAPAGSKIMLTKQYRMASQIMNVINRFYDGQLEMGCTDGEKQHRITASGPRGTVISPSNAVVFVNCKGSDTRQEGSTSYENALEAKVVSELVRMLEDGCIYGKDGQPVADCGEEDLLSMGVISPYAAQTRLIRKSTDRFYDSMHREGRRSAFRSKGEERFMVKSVDDFQGDERDVIILSLVRTSRSAFISDFRRINVAMSRARRLLILVGDAESLENEIVALSEEKKVPVYKEIIDEIKAGGGYLESDDILGGE